MERLADFYYTCSYRPEYGLLDLMPENSPGSSKMLVNPLVLRTALKRTGLESVFIGKVFLNQGHE